MKSDAIRHRIIGLRQTMDICSYSFDEFIVASRAFHGYPAHGLLIGGYMVEEARRYMPEDILYDAISETASCLPDAIQMLTPCTTGNGWLKIFNLGRYALSFYEKFEGKGVRVFLDVSKLDPYPEIKGWYLKLKPKKEQDSKLLQEQIRQAGASVCSTMGITIKPEYLIHSGKGTISICPICAEAYPSLNGDICRSCQGESPYVEKPAFHKRRAHIHKSPYLKKIVPLAKA
jgi:formylmethanofuran dehydrogenase subunit E